MYLLLSVVMGLVQRFLKPPLWLLTIIFVPATLVVVWLGTTLSTMLTFDARTWGLLILAYCAVASVVPVWALLQPRGYLGGFILFLALGLGVIGIFFGGYEIKQEAFKSFDIGGATGTLFPFLFVTIACGACSGFHGLVCSGTTCKQIDKESHIRPVGYGAMLAEGFVAFISLVTIMIVASSDISGLSPATIYGNGIGNFLTLLIGKENLPFAITFGAMAFSTFVFDTLDVCTRLGRYITSGDIPLARQDRRDRRDIDHCRGPCLFCGDLSRCRLARVLDSIRRVKPITSRADFTRHLGLALQGAQADRLHASADVVCADYHPLGAG